ncbi:MAG: PocR ligand-binding domain-containing protein [Candidatus Omnitrophica bacterium]|nr:PocR ligand-binding domain-containing protein [Candidatus Omnitrophota bacterium]
MAEISARKLLELKQWQQIQDLFAEIIGANLSFIDPSGTPFSKPSEVTGFCSDFSIPTIRLKSRPVECAFQAFQNWNERQQHAYQCPHRLNFFSLPVRLRDETIGVVTVGPFLVAKREEEEIYRATCAEHHIDPEPFLDRLREIKIFSHNGIRVITDFLKELTQYIVRLANQRLELERLLPGFMDSRIHGETFFSTAYSGLLVNYLLDLASGFVHADSGSVLLVDESEKSFFVKSARGLRQSVLKKKHIALDSGVAGWVASRKKPVLIGPDGSGEVPKAKLKRPQIKASIVVPLKYRKKVLGVFCLNTNSKNKRFNQDNLLLLDQLGKLASVALLRPSEN